MRMSLVARSEHHIVISGHNLRADFVVVLGNEHVTVPNQVIDAPVPHCTMWAERPPTIGIRFRPILESILA